MATSVLRDQEIWLGGYELSGITNAVSLEYGVDTVDDTTFGDSTRSAKPSLQTVKCGIEGFFDASIDAALFSNFAAKDQLLTIASNSAVGSPAYFYKAGQFEYKFNGQVGEMFSYSASASPTKANLIRGTLFTNGVGSFGGNSAVQQLGAVPSGGTLVMALHVFSASGTSPTLDINLRSDDNAGFSSPTTRISTVQATGIGSQLLTLAGPITDTYWRHTYTIGGTGPSFGFAVVVAII